jgi:hypothetical protein
MKLLNRDSLCEKINEKIRLGGSFFVINITFLFLFIFVAIYLILLSHSMSNGIQCQYKNITGLECETCGYTRAFVFYLNGEFSKGIEVNRSSILYFICFCYLFLTRLIWVIYSLFIQKRKFSKKNIFIDIMIASIMMSISTMYIYLV